MVFLDDNKIGVGLKMKVALFFNVFDDTALFFRYVEMVCLNISYYKSVIIYQGYYWIMNSVFDEIKFLTKVFDNKKKRDPIT